MKKDQHIYQFKIALKGIKPPIWRRIQVPASYTFWDLHVAIQDAMGWLDHHLHQFEVLNPQTETIDVIGIPDPEGWATMKIYPGWKKHLSSYFSLSHTTATYDYDFGDSWSHTLLLENILPFKTNTVYPCCIAGKRACPPEDCGGIWGYKELLDIIKNPDHEEYHEKVEWLGKHFNPEEFDCSHVTFDDPITRRHMVFGEGLEDN